VSHRLEQLTAAIERGVREVMARGFSDPRIGGLITVTGVKVLPDLSRAIISVSVLPEEKQDLTFHGLASAAQYIRREVGKLVETRQLPQFEFVLDSSLKKQAAIFRELDKVKAEIQKADAARADQASEGAGTAEAEREDEKQ
jgi:ribosome-binding factor A